jgi:hypothetical protein
LQSKMLFIIDSLYQSLYTYVKKMHGRANLKLNEKRGPIPAPFLLSVVLPPYVEDTGMKSAE